MKTPEQWAARIQNSKEPWAKLVQEIQLDAFKAGMTEAYEICEDFNYTFKAQEAILRARDKRKTI